MPQVKDYVKLVPLPLEEQKGVKIQARSLAIYNPTEPKRTDVRKYNYDRRQQQNLMGFRSVPYKPYQGIGDPFYLDEEEMVIRALGQWDESQDFESYTSSDDEDKKKDPTAVTLQKKQASLTAAKFVLRRSRKDLNTLPKEVTHGRNMIRNVRLGHGLFDMIKQEETVKKAAEAIANRKKAEAARNAWQPPKRDSSSDVDTDEDDDDDVDLDSYMLSGRDTDEEGFDRDAGGDTSPDSSPEPKGRVTFSGMGFHEGESKPVTPAVPALMGSHKKKQPLPRPYTPQHTNIYEHSQKPSKDALFRQLCALHWILEAMNIEQSNFMSPITSCWNLNEIGGYKNPAKKAQREKLAETKWDQFITNIQVGRPGKRMSTSKGVKPGQHTRRSFINPRTSVQSSVSSPYASSSQLSGMTPSHGHQVARIDATIPEDSTLSSSQDDDPAINESLFKFLDEYYESLRVEEEKKTDDSPGKQEQTVSAHDRRKKEKRSADIAAVARRRKVSRKSDISPADMESRIQAVLGQEKMSSRSMRANIHSIKSKSSTQVIEFQASLPSNRYGILPLEMRQKFAEVQEDKALTLHDILEQMETQRQVVCKNKFIALRSSTHGSSFWRAIDDMRRKSEGLMNRPQQDQLQKKSNVKGNWYTVLLEIIPQELKNEWYYKTILDKLGKFGLVEGTGKQSLYKFLKVLAGLREWEICSPDISAAIEFCRGKIVEMTVEEYEEWFQQQFPKVTRPQTAPPASKSDRKDASTVDTMDTKERGRSARTKSASVRRSQR